jgi:hypothetical protein
MFRISQLISHVSSTSDLRFWLPRASTGVPNRPPTHKLEVAGWASLLEAAVHDELKFLGLAPLFGAIGALATAAAWHVFAITILDLVPARLAVLSCLGAGLAGPLVVWMAVLFVIRRQRSPLASALRRAAAVGLGLVVAAELGFYIPLGFFAIAFH